MEKRKKEEMCESERMMFDERRMMFKLISFLLVLSACLLQQSD